MIERDDWETPDIPRPATLTEKECQIVHRELKAGASEEALARYFDTTVSEIRAANEREEYKWTILKKQK